MQALAGTVRPLAPSLSQDVVLVMRAGWPVCPQPRVVPSMSLCFLPSLHFRPSPIRTLGCSPGDGPAQRGRRQCGVAAGAALLGSGAVPGTGGTARHGAASGAHRTEGDPARMRWHTAGQLGCGSVDGAGSSASLSGAVDTKRFERRGFKPVSLNGGGASTADRTDHRGAA